jgi:tRNA U55 pseudouridine synthase TruB
MEVSTGFYIRQFVYDLKTRMNFPMLVYDIHRVDISKKMGNTKEQEVPKKKIKK